MTEGNIRNNFETFFFKFVLLEENDIKKIIKKIGWEVRCNNKKHNVIVLH